MSDKKSTILKKLVLLLLLIYACRIEQFGAINAHFKDKKVRIYV